MIAQPIIERALRHAREHYPRECCALVVAQRNRPYYWPCRNIAERDDNFVIDPADYAAAEDAGLPIAVVHSHCDRTAQPSPADVGGCEDTALPWLIVSWPSGAHCVLTPANYEVPLHERQFCYGTLDCYSIVRDYYAQRLGVALPDYARHDTWWQRGGNLFIEHHREAGFARVEGDIREHDVVLMQVRGSAVPNHAAVYVGEGRILQHLEGRLSGEQLYDGYWQRHTCGVYRHRSMA